MKDEAEEAEEPEEEEEEEEIQRDSVYVWIMIKRIKNSLLKNILILFYVVLLILQIMSKL